MANMKAKLTIGTRTNIPNQGDLPASAARRTLIVTAIHRKGSVQRNRAQGSHSGAGRRIAVRALSSGFRKSHGQKTDDV